MNGSILIGIAIGVALTFATSALVLVAAIILIRRQAEDYYIESVYLSREDYEK